MFSVIRADEPSTSVDSGANRLDVLHDVTFDVEREATTRTCSAHRK